MGGEGSLSLVCDRLMLVLEEGWEGRDHCIQSLTGWCWCWDQGTRDIKELIM